MEYFKTKHLSNCKLQFKISKFQSNLQISLHYKSHITTFKRLQIERHF